MVLRVKTGIRGGSRCISLVLQPTAKPGDSGDMSLTNHLLSHYFHTMKTLFKTSTGKCVGMLFEKQFPINVILILLIGFSPVCFAEMGNCLQFDGTNDYVDCGSDIVLSNRSFTVEFWVRRDSGGTWDLIAAQGPNEETSSGLHIGFRSSDCFTFAFYHDDYNSTETFTDTQWRHFACVYDAGSLTRTVYCNGEELTGTGTTATNNFLGSGTFYLGRREQSYTNYFPGMALDEFRIWDYARTQSEISENMLLELTGDEPGLIACYSFNQSGTTSLTDLSTNQNDGVLYGPTWTNSTVLFLEITNQAATVSDSVSEYTVGGRVCAVGNISWTNAANAVSGLIPLSDSQLQIAAIPLAVGKNLITVCATNQVGDTVCDSVTITRDNQHSGDSPIHYVSLSGAAVWPYTNWTGAATNIQDAVDVAVDGDTILVTNGTYVSDSEIRVSKAITLRSANAMGSVIIDGQNTNSCFNLGNTACTLSGFIIQNGNPGTTVDDEGGGVCCSGTRPLITNCILRSNSAYYGGGSFEGTLTHCTLIGNTAIYGGGGSCRGTLTHCALIGNSASGGGGSAGGTLVCCTIFDNSVSASGGGNAEGTLTHCTLINNTAAGYGGGGLESTLTHCTLIGNSAGAFGGGTRRGTLKNSIVWANTAGSDHANVSGDTISSSCFSGSYYTDGGGNIMIDPLFSDAAGHLQSVSPCIDAGAALSGLTEDIDGTPVSLDGNADGIALPDMGACEFASFSVDTDGDGLSDGVEVHTFGTNPSDTDSDGDGRNDGDEVASGYLPDYDESKFLTDGEANVTRDPSAYGLYTSNSITDLAMGEVMLQISNGWICLNLQLEQCTNLVMGAWTNAGDAVNWQCEAPVGKAFFRVKGTE